MAFPTSSSSSSFGTPREKYEDVFSAINGDILNNSLSVMNECGAKDINELAQFIREGIANTDLNVWKGVLPRLMSMADTEHNQDLFDRISAICEEKKIKVTITKQEGASSSSSSIAPALTLQEKIPGQMESIGPNIFRIKCMDQLKSQGGDVTCGYHALKNALVALGIGEGHFPLDSDPHLFEDKALYENIEPLICMVRDKRVLADGKEDHDEVSVPILATAWDRIVKNEIHPFPKVDAPMNWNRNELSLFDSVTGDRLVITDPHSIGYAANLKEFAEKQGPCRHAFLVGGEGHWVTVICEKDEQQKLRWYGIDSMLDSKSNNYILQAIQLIDKALQNIDKFVIQQYDQCIGEILERKISLHFATSTKNPPDPHDVETVKIAARFMERIGWLDGKQSPLVDGFIEELKQFAAYYAQNGIEDPLFSKILSRVTHPCSDVEIALKRLDLRSPLGIENIHSKLLEGMIKEHLGNWDSIMEFTRLFVLLSPELADKLFERIDYKKSPEEIRNLINTISAEDPKAQKKWVELLRSTTETTSDITTASLLAEAIMENISIFTSTDLKQAARVQKLIDIATYAKTAISPNRLRELKNPYRIAKEHELIQMTQEPEKKLVNLQGQCFVYNVGVIHTWGVSKLFRKDIPKGVPEDTLEELFHNLEKRVGQDPAFIAYMAEEKYDPISTLTREERAKMLAQERKDRNNPSYELPVPTLQKSRDNFVENFHIQKYLALPTEENAPIETEQYQLYCIMQNLLKADSTVPPGELVSPQEVMLLQYSKYITECLAGINQGIRNTYKVIPGVKEIRIEEDSTKVIEDFTYKFFRDKIIEVIDSEQFIQALLNKTSIQQGNHQSIFIKNRFGKLVGLIPNKQLDIYTHNLYNEILRVTPEQFLTVFYQFYDPSKVLQGYMTALQTELTTVINKKDKNEAEKKLFMQIQDRMVWANIPIVEALVLDEETFTRTEVTPVAIEAIVKQLQLIEKPNIKSMSADEIIQMIKETGQTIIDLSECTHLNPKEIDTILSHTRKLTLEEIRQRYPDLQIVDETFWEPYKDLGIKVDKFPVFDHNAAEMTKVLDLFQTKGVVEGDAGGTLLLLPEGLTFNMVLSILETLGLSKGTIDDSIKKEFGSKANERSRGILLSNNVLNGSRKKSVDDQRKMVEGLGGNMPSLLATLVVLIATHKLQNGKRLFGVAPCTYTRVIEQIYGYPTVVGGFSRAGPFVDLNIYDNAYFGVALALG